MYVMLMVKHTLGIGIQYFSSSYVEELDPQHHARDTPMVSLSIKIDSTPSSLGLEKVTE